jgi:hypothetical protein
MDETKIELPAWLPWATTACLAALVACLCELWIIERTRNQLVKDEKIMAESSLKGVQYELEAERIINKREIGQLRSGAIALAIGEATLLLEPGVDPSDPLLSTHPWGAAGWNSETQTGCFRFLGLPTPAAGRDYQLWIDASGEDYPQAFMVETDPVHDWIYTTVRPAWPLPPKHRFLLFNTPKGGAKTLDEAKATGSIILASLPPSPKISNP